MNSERRNSETLKENISGRFGLTPDRRWNVFGQSGFCTEWRCAGFR
jgi:hypothetical protein